MDHRHAPLSVTALPVPLLLAGFGVYPDLATPANAIAYGSGVGREHVLRAGVVLEAVVILVVTAAAFAELFLAPQSPSSESVVCAR